MRGLTNSRSGGGSNLNLLDNWDFSDPVNQRGKSTYTGTGIYAIDRWKLVDKTGTLTVKSGGIGISFNSSEGFTSIGQYFENLEDLIGKTATASVLLSDGTIKSVTFKNLQSNSDVSGADFDVGYLNLIMPYKCFRIMITKNSSVTIKAVKLELGEVSTLKNDILGVNYSEELIKCKQYLWRINAISDAARLFGACAGRGENLVLSNIMLPDNFRKTDSAPVIEYSNSSHFKVMKGLELKSVTSIQSSGVIDNSVTVDIYSSGIITGEAYSFVMNKGSWIQFSKEL